MASDLVKTIDDLLRQELSILGFDYNSVVSGVEDMRASEGAIVRMKSPWEDIEFDRPDASMSRDAFAARVARRLRVALEAPERPPAPDE